MERYTHKPCKDIWLETNKFNLMLQVEISHLQALMETGLIDEMDLSPMQNFKFSNEDLASIQEIEKLTKHETLAFLTFLENKFPNETKFLHYGLTSSDALDTAHSIQMLEAGKLIHSLLWKLLTTLKEKIILHADTLMIGRTHGMHAEPTTFGYILAGHHSEFKRNEHRLWEALDEVSVGKMSGPVGNYTNSYPDLEKLALSKLNIHNTEYFATQVIARDRYANFFCSLALIASAIERLATTIRHLQRPEINEVCEGFSQNQKGSSSMPHKKNPILCENLCGLARVVRSSLQPAFDNINLWHERDMSHSSVERFICPETTETLCFMLERMTSVVNNLVVNKESMRSKIEIWGLNPSNGNYASQTILLRLIDAGASRQEAYGLLQKASFDSQKNTSHLEMELRNIPRVMELLSEAEIADCFDTSEIVKNNKDYILSIFSQ